MRLFAAFPLQWPGFQPRSGNVGFVVDKVALWQVLPEYFGFPCQVSINSSTLFVIVVVVIIIIHYPRLVQ
jgi:hypothetical protein